ncbi:MAG: hypothetical protein K2P12_01930, partial [Clostridia bacterium]|nr:hypothetical protein [Clostridia bacterium]
PTNGVIIILAVSSDSAMLQTIKSRTKKIYLNIWNYEDLAKELSKIDINHKNIELATKFSKGNLTKAKSLLTDENFQNCYQNMLALLTDFTSTALIGQFVKNLGIDKEQIAYSMSIIEGIISDTISDITTGIESELTNKYRVSTLANLSDLVVETNKRLNSNCNPQAVATNFLLKLAEIKYLTAEN